jgi:phosphotransferase system enzyme I (PtsI)
VADSWRIALYLDEAYPQRPALFEGGQSVALTDFFAQWAFRSLHPAVLKLIAQAIVSSQKAKVPIAVCGEMAGDLQLTRLLLGLGLRNFSMHPSQLLPIKERILRTRLADVQALAQRVLRASDPAKTRELLAKLNS